MSISATTKQCANCRHTYICNPSVGKFGMLCKCCGKGFAQPLVPAKTHNAKQCIKTETPLNVRFR